MSIYSLILMLIESGEYNAYDLMEKCDLFFFMDELNTYEYDYLMGLLNPQEEVIYDSETGEVIEERPTSDLNFGIMTPNLEGE